MRLFLLSAYFSPCSSTIDYEFPTDVPKSPGAFLIDRDADEEAIAEIREISVYAESVCKLNKYAE